jgi:hypothetical protein
MMAFHGFVMTCRQVWDEFLFYNHNFLGKEEGLSVEELFGRCPINNGPILLNGSPCVAT